jgi:hypothetical protein
MKEIDQEESKRLKRSQMKPRLRESTPESMRLEGNQLPKGED